jgi:hypothetical protein
MYEKRLGRSDLQQGDLLNFTDQLKSAINEHIPKYDMSTCRGFLVLTQSCDLVRRSGQCSARYISLAIVKYAEDAIAEELTHVQDEVQRQGEFIGQRARSSLDNLIDRLLNNNADGRFFFREEQRFSVGSNLCAFLPLTVTMPLTTAPQRISLYTRCRTARIVGINGAFQAKLGWLMGNMYSRVATDDFSEKAPEHWNNIRCEMRKTSAWVIAEDDCKRLIDSLRKQPPEGGLTPQTAKKRFNELGLNLGRKARVLSRIDQIMEAQHIDTRIHRILKEALRTDAELNQLLGR